MKAPEHLRGKMTNLPASLRAERNAWIVMAADEGYTQRRIAQALGVSVGSVHSALHSLGYRRKPKMTWEALRSSGVRLGVTSDAVDAMPEPAREKLVMAAIKQRKDAVRVMADFWAQHHGADA